MTIDRLFFADALTYFEPDVGAILGVTKEDLGGRTTIERFVKRHSSMSLSLGKLPPDVLSHSGGFSAGTMIIRTDAVRKVGSYNPFFRAAEDMDVRERLVLAGWRVLDVPVVQGAHFWASGTEPLDVQQYYKTIFRNSVGLGQMAKYHLHRDPRLVGLATKSVLSVRNLISVLPGFGWLSLIALHLLGLATRNTILLAGCFVADVIVAGSVLAWAPTNRLSVRDQLFETLVSPTVFVIVRALGFARGLLLSARGPKDYPAQTATP